MDFHRFIIEVDGSPETEVAVEWCARYAGPKDEVIVVAALSGTAEFALGFPPSNLGYWKKDVERGLEHGWTQRLRDHGITYRTRLVEHAPWKALTSVAGSEFADAIVIGNHRHHWLATTSKMDKVLHHSPIPVIVVPSESTDANPEGPPA